MCVHEGIAGAAGLRRDKGGGEHRLWKTVKNQGYTRAIDDKSKGVGSLGDEGKGETTSTWVA